MDEFTGHFFQPFLTFWGEVLFLEREGRNGYRWGRKEAELERMDYLEFIAGSRRC
jgi:hypothetical protein